MTPEGTLKGGTLGTMVMSFDKGKNQLIFSGGGEIEYLTRRALPATPAEQAPSPVRPPVAREDRATLETRFDAGETITVPLTYNSAAYGYTYMADGTVAIARGKVSFKPTYGSKATPAFDVSPQAIDEVRLESRNPACLLVRVGVVNEKGKVRTRDYYWYPRGARAVGGGPGGQGASIDCTACDDALSTVQQLIGRAQRLPPAGATQPSETGQSAPSTSQLSASEPVKDFGTVSRDRALKWTFELKNTGATELEIVAAKPLCTCAQTTFTKVIKPGTSGNVTATVDVSSFTGAISKVFDVVTSDPTAGTLRLTIKATVLP